MLDLGALSITLLDAKDQPLFQKEPGSTQLWDEVALVCMFPESAELDVLIAWLQENPAVKNGANLSIEVIEDDNWERRWMDKFHAMRFGERLWICPSWQEPPEPNAVTIMLDPGLAFGSGTHATTTLCLEWLEQNPVTGKRVIDYGCGSGVLALAAVLLGASSVDAVDHDPQAIAATNENRDRNGIDSARLRCHLPRHFHSPAVDLVLANILFEPLLTLAPRFAEYVRPGGQLILSGILREQTESLTSRYQTWFNFDPPIERDGWVLLSAIRRD